VLSIYLAISGFLSSPSLGLGSWRVGLGCCGLAYCAVSILGGCRDDDFRFALAHLFLGIRPVLNPHDLNSPSTRWSGEAGIEYHTTSARIQRAQAG